MIFASRDSDADDVSVEEPGLSNHRFIRWTTHVGEFPARIQKSGEEKLKTLQAGPIYLAARGVRAVLSSRPREKQHLSWLSATN